MTSFRSFLYLDQSRRFKLSTIIIFTPKRYTTNFSLDLFKIRETFLKAYLLQSLVRIVHRFWDEFSILEIWLIAHFDHANFFGEGWGSASRVLLLSFETWTLIQAWRVSSSATALASRRFRLLRWWQYIQCSFFPQKHGVIVWSIWKLYGFDRELNRFELTNGRLVRLEVRLLGPENWHLLLVSWV